MNSLLSKVPMEDDATKIHIAEYADYIEDGNDADRKQKAFGALDERHHCDKMGVSNISDESIVS